MSSSTSASSSSSHADEHKDVQAMISANSSLTIAQGPGIPPQWAANLQKVLFTEQQIQKKVGDLAALISRSYEGLDRPLLCVGLLTGAFVFVADILRRLTIPYEVDFMVVSSYGKGTSSSGSVKLKKDMSIDPLGRHVLILEDLIDTGYTLSWIREHLRVKRVASVKTCCLLDKKARRQAQIDVEFIGFECPDEFVVGYGMDFADQYRCLPLIGVLKPEAYRSK